MLKTAFIFCCVLVVYPYAMYPLLLKVLGLFRKQAIVVKSGCPAMTFIISAFNEEEVIKEKIENTLALDYPRAKLEILVVSDCSTDRTDEIVNGFRNNGVLLLSQSERKGKTAGLNDAVNRAHGEILVFSDADSMYETQALKKMAECLSGDPRVGLVTGSTHYRSARESKIVETTSMYMRLESFIKRQESALGSCVGADGAIFAMRANLYQPLQADEINDLVIPLKVVKQGHRAIFHDNLHCYEAPAADASGEFRRQTRITNRTLRALFRNAALMNIFKYPLFSFELVSHKLLRFTVPFFMIALLLLNALLLREGLFYYVTFAAQIAAYIFCLFRFWQERTGRKNNVFNFVYHFVMVNVSMLTGWIKFLSGQKNVIWNPQRQ